MANSIRVDTYIASDTWTAPSGVTSIAVECWGGGGQSFSGLGGGGGGAYAKKNTVSVTPSSGYTVTVGGSGGDSSFNTTSCVAKGGSNGVTGTGGQASASTGDTKFSGGNGSTGSGQRGGGGGAGNSAAGGNGGAGTGGNGGAQNGGMGAANNGPITGFLIGGGAGCNDSTGRSGCRGEVRITYTTDVGSYPAVINRNWNRSTSASTSFSVSMPSGISAGDLLLVVGANISGQSMSMSGWTKLAEQDNSGAIIAVFYKTAAGSDTGTITTGSNTEFTAISYCIQSGLTPEAATATGSDSNPNPPSLTPSGGSQPYLWLASAVLGSGVLDISAYPSGYNSFITEPGFNAGTGDPIALVSCENRTTASSENPGTYTATSGNWSAITIAVPYNSPTSIKTINGLTKASVKTVDELAIASVKTWGGLG